MGKFARVIAASALVIEVAATAAPNLHVSNADDAVEAALDQHNLYAAGIALNNLVEGRLPQKDTGKPDPVLDRTFADVFSAQGQLAPAGAILRRIVSDPATRDLDHYRLLLATYEESIGAWAEAQQQYRQIIADPKKSPEIAIAATFGVARLQMASDPVAALATLSAFDTKAIPSSMAWEFDLLTARSANMVGPDKASMASAALDRAWAEAPYGSVADAAVARVASDRALIAGRTGDRKTLISMLAVDRSSRPANGGQQLVVNDLPICGSYGLTPQDVVSIAVAHLSPAGRPRITLSWASRPGIAAPFMLAAERSGSPTVPDGQVATFNLRCRTSPSVDFVTRNSIEEDIAGWMTDHGAYPDANQLYGEGVSSLATKLAQRQARYGPNSVMLLPLLFRTMLPGAINYADQDGKKQASSNADHILTILDQNKAPASLILMWRITTIAMAVMAQTKTAVEGQAETQNLLRKIADDPALSLDTLYMMSMSTAQMPNTPSNFKLAILSAALDLLNRKAPTGDQRTAAVALRLYHMRNSNGDEDGAKTVITGVSLSKDGCERSNPLPHYVSSNITSDDYPGDLVFMTMPGLTFAEFNLDATGNAREGRLLLEDPPYAFNEIALARIPTIHYDPARLGGQIAACRAVIQSIRWQLPDTSD